MENTGTPRLCADILCFGRTLWRSYIQPKYHAPAPREALCGGAANARSGPKSRRTPGRARAAGASEEQGSSVPPLALNP